MTTRPKDLPTYAAGLLGFAVGPGMEVRTTAACEGEVEGEGSHEAPAGARGTVASVDWTDEGRLTITVSVEVVSRDGDRGSIANVFDERDPPEAWFPFAPRAAVEGRRFHHVTVHGTAEVSSVLMVLADDADGARTAARKAVEDGDPEWVIGAVRDPIVTDVVEVGLAPVGPEGERTPRVRALKTVALVPGTLVRVRVVDPNHGSPMFLEDKVSGGKVRVMVLTDEREHAA